MTARLLRAALVLSFATLATAAFAQQPDALERGFQQPPDSAKPYTWWHWMNGNITAEGLTKDLQEMRRVGLGGAQVFNVDDGIPAGPISYLSPEWRALMKHAIEEADRQKLELHLHNCAGWSSSGGPWVTPEQSMQRLVWTERRVQGPGRVAEPLAQPRAVRDWYRDIAVLAFPTPPADQVTLADAGPTATASAPRVDGKRLVDGDLNTAVSLPKPAPGKSVWLQVELARPFAVRNLTLSAAGGRQGHRGELQTSADGQTFERLAAFALPGGSTSRAVCSINFPATTARFWRLHFTAFEARSNAVSIAEVDLSGAVQIENWAVKAGFDRGDRILPPQGVTDDPEAVIRRAGILDLTARLGPDGRLDWDVPAGDWTILRFGHTSTGKDNHPAPPPGRGLEVDKLSSEAADAFWANGVEPILQDAGPLVGKSLTGILIDSYEVGCQNWTVKLPAEFERRRGYPLLTWLPAMTGRVVDGLEASERFLWDLRRTLGELFADHYFGRFAKLCHDRGLKLAVEPYGNGNFDNLVSGGHADLPMTEFWSFTGGDLGGAKQAASIAHTWGRTWVGAESFTASPENGAWRNDPWSMKALGDRMWCGGINRYIFHRYAHQPWVDRRPGMTMSRWGFHFEWPITWWEQAPAWTGYLARAQYLLQSGRFVGDLLYFIGDSAPNSLGGLSPAPPPGYDYDGCGTDILQQLTVRDFRLVLPSGMSYAVLVLPPTDALLPATLQKIRELVEAGATVVGPRPTRSPSLVDLATGDQAVKATADALWADCDGQTVTEHRLGAGRIVWGRPLPEVLADLQGVAPDVELSGDEVPSVSWIHRTVEGTEVYFVCSRADRTHEVTASFRVSGLQPELWCAETGRIGPAPIFEPAGARTKVRLRFDPGGSVFVVFRRPLAAGDPVVSAEREGPAPPAPPAAELVIEKAVYGVLEQPETEWLDVTAPVRALVQAGTLAIPASNAMAGRDPAPNVVKELRVVFTVGDRRETRVVTENQTIQLPAGATVEKATYGLLGDDEAAPTQQVDVTKQLQALVKDGRLEVVANNEIAGDPANLVVKQLRVEYRLDGARAVRTVNEKQTLRLPPQADDEVAPLVWSVGTATGQPRVTAWLPSKVTLTTASGRTLTADVPAVPEPITPTPPWEVRFPAGWGAPERALFSTLVSWPERAEPGIQYFSGTAEYRIEVNLPAEWIGAGKRVLLDLGRVRNFAEPSLNGQAFGVLWKPPFRVDVTSAAKAGPNELRVRVTNLWPNRLIGDEQLPDDRQWGGDGRMLAWPQWMQEGRSRPQDGRYTWTTWRHYTKDSPLQESGLLGPVVFRAGVEAAAR